MERKCHTLCISGNIHNFITTALWNVLITMTTVGYGDFYPRSHMGRFVGIITSFWGVFYVSLFVVSLTNTLEFESPQIKSFMLLKRLKLKAKQREYAGGMLVAGYKLKLLKEKKNVRDKIVAAMRKYRIDFQNF